MGGIIRGKIVGATQITGRVCASSISAGDYTITIDPIEGGYRLRVERGSEVQTMELLDGKAGTDGQASYVHIKYSSVPNPASSDEMSDVPQDYIGIYADNAPEDSSDPADYTWARIKGEPGLKGDPGQDAPQDAVLYTPQTLIEDQQAQALENIGAASAERVQKVENALPGKLTEPAEGLAVGKYFRVAALDENGHAVLEAVDAPVGGLSTEPSLWPAWTADDQAAARERIGIDEPYELIDSFTIDEESVLKVIRESEPDGTEYNFKKLMVSITTFDTNMSGLCRIVCGHINTGKKFDEKHSAIFYNAAYNFTHIFCRKQNGLWINEAVLTHTNGVTRSMYSEIDNRNTNYNTITGLLIQYNNYFIPGTKIEIFGVRA